MAESAAVMTNPISRQALWSHLHDGPSVALVETLAPDFYDNAHLPGAVNITPHTAPGRWALS
jgi:hypothetical protein